MAYKNNAVEEHAFKTIDKQIKSGKLSNLLCFYGKEEFLIKWATEAIINKFINPACKEMDFAKIDGNLVSFEQIKNSCETMPFLSEKRVVLVTELKILEGGKNKNFNEEDENSFGNYIKSLPENCILIITAGALDKRKKICKSILETGAAYDFCELDEKSLKAYIEKKFKAAGKAVKSSVVSELIRSSGYYDKDTDYTLYNLENDIKKAIAYSDSQEVMYKDVENTVSGNVETNVFAMIDAIGRGNKEEAYKMLHNLLSSGENEYKIIGLLCSHFEIILCVKELKEEAKTLKEISELMKIHEFRVKKAALFADKYSVKQLRNILKKAYGIDKNIKTGLLEAKLAMEIFISEI